MKNMSMKMAVVLAAVLVTAGLGGAQEKKKPEENKEFVKRYGALQIGLDIMFKVTDIDAQGAKTENEFRLRCTRKETVSSVECHALDIYLAGSRLRSAYWAVDSEGLKLYRITQGEQDSVFETPDICLKSSLEKGETWTWEGDKMGKKVKIQHRNEGEEQVQVPAGKFECIKMYDEAQQYTDEETWKLVSWGNTWYAKDKGIVKQDYYFVLPSGEKNRELIEMKDFKITPPDPPKKGK